MTVTPVAINQFGGLQLGADPLGVGSGAAVSCTDVALDTIGRLRTRDGYTALATTSTAPTTMHVHTSTSSATQFLTSSTTKLEAFDAFGVAAATVAATGPHSFTNAGTPSTPVAYAVASGDASLRKWNGTAWSTPAGAPGNARCIGWDPDSSRLVVAGHNGGDRVQWSDAGAPDTWTSTSWVDLTPGDGEFITAMCVWQGQVFVFKQTKFYVFTGESTDSTGKPSFDYRTVNGIGAAQGVGDATAVATPQGVYFISQDGLYHTAGGIPQLVSQPLASVFGGVLGTRCSLAWHFGRLLMNIGAGVTVTTYVWYRATGQWAKWSVQDSKAGGMFAAGDDVGGMPPHLYWVNGTDSKVYDMSTGSTTDNGSAIAWSYQSGKYPLAKPGEVAITRESRLFGTGTVTLTVSSEMYADQSAAVTLGTSPTPAEGWLMKDQEGQHFQHTLSGSGVATVEQLTHYVGSVRAA
jgi:hypothetical protein